MVQPLIAVVPLLVTVMLAVKPVFHAEGSEYVAEIPGMYLDEQTVVGPERGVGVVLAWLPAGAAQTGPVARTEAAAAIAPAARGARLVFFTGYSFSSRFLIAPWCCLTWVKNTQFRPQETHISSAGGGWPFSRVNHC
jgi:hypothetical protein